MLRVSRVDEWLSRLRDSEPARPDLRNSGDCMIIRSICQRPAGQASGMGGSRPPSALAPAPAGSLPAEPAPARPAGGQDCRRSDGDQRPGGSGPSSGKPALRLHLVLLPPGTRGTAHFHQEHGTSVYLVSGEAEAWHGAGLASQSAVRAGDVVYIPPGVPHLVVNRGDVSAIAVVARTDPAAAAGTVAVEFPRHLADLARLPVGGGE
jgi:uncharacterized RmlC-like cupin family protein